jgi:hypothetical protein
MKRLAAALVVCTFLSTSPASYSRSARCPRDPLPITNADRPTAKRAVLRYLRRAYRSPALINGKSLMGDLLRGAKLSARLATDPRAGFRLMPKLECGTRVWRRTIIVAAYLPAVARQAGTDLAQLTFFVSRQPSGWVVWERAH